LQSSLDVVFSHVLTGDARLPASVISTVVIALLVPTLLTLQNT